MDLNTITAVAHPHDAGPIARLDGRRCLARGRDLAVLGTAGPSDPADRSHRPEMAGADRSARPNLSISATCTVAQLDALACPPEWIASPLINQCCRAFLASFKIWKTATVGGNICMSLPAGPMISLTSALDGVCTIWQADGGERKIAVADFVTGDQRNVLAPGDLLRQIDIPLAALKRRSAFRQISLTPVGRSAALLIGSVTGEGGLALTVTASTRRPVQIVLRGNPKRQGTARNDSAAHCRRPLPHRPSRQASMAQAYDAAARGRDPRRIAGHGISMTFQINGKEFSRSPASRAMPAHVPARARAFRRQEGLRRRRLRRLHRADRRRAGA